MILVQILRNFVVTFSEPTSDRFHLVYLLVFVICVVYFLVSSVFHYLPQSPNFVGYLPREKPIHLG